MKKLILLSLLLISSIVGYSQVNTFGGIGLRVNDTTSYQANAAAYHAAGYYDIYFNNQATNDHWDVWNGSSYDHIFVFNSGSGITREFNRTFSEELVFNKNEIFHTPIVMEDDINLTVSPDGLEDQSSTMRLRMTTDGIHSINFGDGFDFIYGIGNGQVLEAGTYEFYFIYTNGSVSVNVPGFSAESSSATVLSVPADFVAVDDGESDIDLSWDDVSNESSYLVQYSLTGAGGWTTLSTPAANATTTTQGSLSAGDTRYYRIKAIGDGISFLSSDFSEVISGQTSSGSDVTDPAFTFSPVNGVSTWTVNKVVTITSDEPLRNTDASPIDNNDAGIITLKQTNSGGANISCTWTIDATKTIITITPTTHYGENQLVYVAINNVEDVNGNEVTTAISSTFTTTEFTTFNGTSSRLAFGDIIDAVITANDADFWFELTVNNILLSGSRILVSKSDQSANQRGVKWYHTGSDVFFAWYRFGTSGEIRVVKWAGALSTGDHDLVVKYNGSIDTNNGLDRLTLLVDGVTAGSKTLSTTSGGVWPFNIFDNIAQLTVGVSINSSGAPVVGDGFLSGEAKDFIVRSSAGSVIEVNVPNLKTGTDTSGNSRNGTWAP